MKRAVSARCCCLAVRLAALAGAGESAAAWVREIGGKTRLPPRRGRSRRSRRRRPCRRRTEAVGAAPAADWVLVAVTPPPTAEEGTNSGEQAAQTVAADLSADTLLHKRRRRVGGRRRAGREGRVWRCRPTGPSAHFPHTFQRGLHAGRRGPLRRERSLSGRRTKTTA